jgi:alanine-synthesizing transaminase
MRRNLLWHSTEHLRYEIREIVEFAQRVNKLGRKIIWENIGDPIEKGETVPPWIKEIIRDEVMKDKSYGYVATMGELSTREYLARLNNEFGGAQITADDILFFNGLGDGVARIFGFLRREARVLGPSPAYSTLSSAEAAHSGYAHTTYNLDWRKGWIPDLEDIENKVKYNDAIAGILLINPDNPTGAVYPKDILLGMVDIARRYDLFVLSDETYANIVYPGVETARLSQVIGDVPGIALRSISKEFPWPGGRCGWAEIHYIMSGL